MFLDRKRRALEHSERDASAYILAFSLLQVARALELRWAQAGRVHDLGSGTLQLVISSPLQSLSDMLDEQAGATLRQAVGPSENRLYIPGPDVSLLVLPDFPEVVFAVGLSDRSVTKVSRSRGWFLHNNLGE